MVTRGEIDFSNNIALLTGAAIDMFLNNLIFCSDEFYSLEFLSQSEFLRKTGIIRNGARQMEQYVWSTRKQKRLSLRTIC